MEPRDAILETLRLVHDPCCRERGISVVDMGLVRSITVEERSASVELMLTSGWCPFAARVLEEVKGSIEALPEIDRASVEITWDEAWTTERMSPDALARLRFLPEPAQAGDRDRYIARERARAAPTAREGEAAGP